MQVTHEQLAIFEAGLAGLIAARTATYTVDNKRITPEQLGAPLDAGIRDALNRASLNSTTTATATPAPLLAGAKSRFTYRRRSILP
jgi:hypothetical protein